MTELRMLPPLRTKTRRACRQRGHKWFYGWIGAFGDGPYQYCARWGCRAVRVSPEYLNTAVGPHLTHQIPRDRRA